MLSEEEFCIQWQLRLRQGGGPPLLCSILFTVQGVFIGEELLSEEEFCIQWQLHSALLCSLFRKFNREELLSKEEFCIQPGGRGSSAPSKEEALLCSILFTV